MTALALLLALAPCSAQEKRAIPDPAELKDAEKTIRDLFKADLAKKAPADRSALAKKLLAQGRDGGNSAASQYALLREALGAATQAGDVETALAAMNEIERAFAVDLVEHWTSALAALAKTVRTQEEIKALSNAYLDLLEAAMKLDDFDGASKAADAAAAQARRARDVPALNKANDRKRDIPALRSRFDRIRKAKELLAAQPDDPAANLEVGKYYCLVKEDWAVGLPLLAKSPEGPLKEAALKDASNPQSSEAQVATGNVWWECGETAAKKEEKGPCRARAGHWYAQALPKLAGLDRLKVEQRLGELNRERLSRGTWVDLDDPAMFGRRGKPGDPLEVVIDKPGTASILESKAFPPGEYDAFTLRIRCRGERMSVGIGYKGDGWERQPMIQLNTGESRITTPGPGYPTGPVFLGPLAKAEEYILTIVLGDGEHAVFVNGLEASRFPDPHRRFDLLKLYTNAGSVLYDGIRLRKR